jgi:hypothetical protein
MLIVKHGAQKNKNRYDGCPIPEFKLSPAVIPCSDWRRRLSCALFGCYNVGLGQCL